MMDVVYIVGKGSKFGNVELRYSLRSIDKYAIGLGRVFIIGYIPSFINRARVTCIEMDDPYPIASVNVYHKIKAAIECDDVSEEFLVSSDDHFFTRPTDFINYPIYFKSHQLPTHADEHSGKYGGVQYTTGMANTRDFMDRFGLGCMYFEGHTNKLYSKEAWRELDKLGLWNAMESSGLGFSTNSPMLTMYCRMHPGAPTMHRKDVKIHAFESYADIEDSISLNDSFSIGDEALRCGIKEWLHYHFPEKSKFEK